MWKENLFLQLLQSEVLSTCSDKATGTLQVEVRSIHKVVFIGHAMQPTIAILFHGDGVSPILSGMALLFNTAGWIPDTPSLHKIVGMCCSTAI